MTFGRVNPKFRLEDQGIKGLGNVSYNLMEPALIEAALKNGEGTLGNGGAFLCSTGKFTGRSPKDKHVVKTRQRGRQHPGGKTCRHVARRLRRASMRICSRIWRAKIPRPGSGWWCRSGASDHCPYGDPNWLGLALLYATCCAGRNVPHSKTSSGIHMMLTCPV